MSTSKQIATLLRAVYFGGNWTASNLKDQIKDVTWEQALIKVDDCNTIATLVYHMNYYVVEVTKMLEGNPLMAKDKLSFNHPPVESQEDWDKMLQQVWKDAEHFASLIEQLPEDIWWADFNDGKYGNYYRNIQGIVEHLHYHLGQIVILKKVINQQT